MLIVPVNIKINGILIFLWHLNFYATPYVRYVADKCLLKIKNVNYLNLLNVVPNVFKVNNQFSLDFPCFFNILNPFPKCFWNYVHLFSDYYK